MALPFSRARGGKLGRPTELHRRLALESLEDRLALSVNVLTYHYDTASSGLNAAETQLTPANVNATTFGKLSTTALDGQVYAEPLVDTGVTIADGINTTVGAAGVHDVVYVATEHDSLYAIDTGSGAVLWQRTFLGTTNAGGNINNTLGATAITSVPNGDTGSSDITPEVGITGTPVIDSTTNILYVSVKTKEAIGGADYYVQRMHAINIADGTDVVAPYRIGETTNGNTNTTDIYVYGSGDGSVTDPYNNTGKSVVQFNALREANRGGLSLVNNTLYETWASHGDNGPYHGWVVTWNVTNIKTTGFTNALSGVLNTSPNDGLAGIWMGSGRLVFDPDEAAFYFVTGNGSGGAPTLDANGFPTDANYNEAVVKVEADTTHTSASNQNANGWGLEVADYFIPYNVAALDSADSDFGSGGLIIVPDSLSAGIAGHTHLLLASGKAGQIYVIDRDKMGHYDATNDAVVNAVPNGSGHNTAPNLISGSLSTPAYFNGKFYWVSGYNGRAYSYSMDTTTGALSVSSQTTVGNFGYLPGSVVVSADGTSNGVVWVMDRQNNELHAYDASTMATELWNSSQRGGDSVGVVIKFAIPTVANGEVFVGNSDSLVIYGLTAPPNAAPDAPTLAANPLSGSTVNLTWTDPTASPNLASSYVVQYSLDGNSFSTIATAAAGSSALAVSGLQQLTKYYFRIYGVNSFGSSQYSDVASATTTATLAGIDFSSGFIGAAAALTLNGSAKVNGSQMELTDGGGGEAASVFTTSPFDITKFNTQFTFQLTNAAADGFTFCIQGAGPTALGPAGGGLGYGPDGGGAGGINNSVAIKFDLYNNAGEGTDSTGLYTDGAAPTNTGSLDMTASGVNLSSGDAMNVSISYDGTTLYLAINDPTAGRTFTHSFTIDIPGTVGGNTAYLGFTGGTGGATAVQNIMTWTYVATTGNSGALIFYPAGLAGAASQLTVNGSAALGPTTTVGDLRLTSGAGGQSGSAFTTTPIDITKFTTQFSIMLSAGANTADGLTFCIQGNGPTALGDGGGSLAYANINNSIAIKFDLYNNNGEGVDSTGLFTSGAQPFDVGSIDLTNTGIDLHSGDPLNVILAYDGTTLTESITDPVTNASAVETYTVNIPSIVGGNTAYVGFTGATGGVASTQNILTWSFLLPVVSPNAPSGLGGAPATDTSISVNWTNNAANQTGFHLDRATDANFTQNLVTQSLPATPFTFTDSAAGLAPGTTYYYRIRAFNSAGDSGNSNTVSITIPVAPPKPSDQSITDLTTDEIDIAWQDNAGHDATEYDILRAVNHGAFSIVAILPPTSRPAPSEYDWSDTDLTPGYFYEYHIEAVNSSGHNDFAGVNATTVTLPPTSLSAVTVGNSVQLSWMGPANGAVSYNVYRSTTAGGESGKLLKSRITTTNYTDPSAIPGTGYYYEVTADNGNDTYTPPLPDESDFSNEAAAVVPSVTIGSPSTSHTSGGPISFTITYADPFLSSSTLAPGNVTLNATGTATGTIGVSGTPNARTVTISNITGNGTLGISIAAGTATDSLGNSFPGAGPSTTVAVDQTVTSITVTPVSPALSAGASQHFTAVAKNAYGDPLAVQPAFTWSVASGNGGINGSGLYTAPYATGSATVQAASGTISGTASVTYTGQAQWNSATSDSWNVGADWIDTTSGNPIAPPGLRGVAGDTALFGAAGGSPVRLDGTSPAVAAITFDNSATSYVISQGSGGTLQLDNGGNNALISVAHGSHTISAPIMLNSSLSIAPASGTTLTLSGTIAGAGESLTVSGQGVVVLSGGNSYGGGTIVSSGKVVVTDPSSLLNGSSLTVGNWTAPASPAPAAVIAAAVTAGPSANASSAAATPSSTSGGILSTPIVQRRLRLASGADSTVPAAPTQQPAFFPRAVDSMFGARNAAGRFRGDGAVDVLWLDGPNENKDRVIRALDAVLARFGI